VSRHLAPETLGALVEGGLAGEEARRARDHLFECRSCMAAYVDGVRYRAAWLADAESFAADAGQWRAGRHAGLAGGPLRSGRPAGRAWRVAWAAGGALAAALVAVVLLRPGYAPALAVDLPPAVRAANERLSGEGLVLPGGARGAHFGPSGMRSGQGASSLELERELDDLLAEYESAPGHAARGVRLVGAFLAVGELDAARSYAREVLQRNPRHVPALVQAAAIEYRMNEPGRARELLQRASREAPRDPIVALDLALVLEQGGHADRARPLFEHAGRSRVKELAARAERELRE
jgi:tetratricopeptide (TPR) repeat protein